MSQVDASQLRCEHRTQPSYTDLNQQHPLWTGERVQEPGGWQSLSASLGRPRSSKASEKHRAANDNGDHQQQQRRPDRPDWTRARAEGASVSDNSKQAIVGVHLGQSSCPASDACEPMRAPAPYRPHQGQAPDFVGRLHAEAARKQHQVNYPCCVLVGSPRKSAEQVGGGQHRQQQQVAASASMAVAPPIAGGQVNCNERLGMANHGCPALDCDEADDSECSCSNSLDCLASQPIQPPAHHHHQPPPPPPPTHQQQQLSPSLRQHQHQHHLDQEECSFMESHQQNNRQRQPHQAQTFHRPLMANSSVSTLPASPGVQMSGSPPRQAPPVAPPPPSAAPQQAAGPAAFVVRQATYTATADTITDSSLMSAPVALTPPQQQQAVGASDFSNPANDWRQQQVVGQYRARTGAEPIELQPAQQKAALKLHATSSGGGNTLGKQRQAISFRRSATSVSSGQQQQHRQRAQTMSRNSQLEQQQAPPTMPGQVILVAGESDTTRGPASANKATPTTTATNTSTTGQQQSNGADRQAIGLQHVCPSSSVVGGAANPAHLHRQQHLAGGAYSPGQPLTISPAATTRGLPLRGSHLLASQQLNGTFSLPPISSHRTNSPWMRISSIILAPLGLVIVLFIVVSPLLHSKTKF